jgi:hypothetical protein
MAKKQLGYLECETASDDFGYWVITQQRLLARDDIRPKPTGNFQTWLDWAEPGAVYRMRNGTLYQCIQVTMEE